MPFVPLGSRKRIEVVLDGDKEAIRAKQAARDDAAIQRHLATAPSQAGYRFANHPMTRGMVRGPPVPFQGGSGSWKPPELDPEGPAGRQQRSVAPSGAVWEASHSFRADNHRSFEGLTMKGSRSSPMLATTGEAVVGESPMEQCHPMYGELNRWKKMAHHSIKHELNPNIDIPKSLPRIPTPEKKLKPMRGLVNFPKYMLIHNCHLKLKDLQRYQKEQEAEKAAQQAEDEEMEAAMMAAAAAAGEVYDPSKPGSAAQGSQYQSFEEEFSKASWGEPRLKNADNPEDIYAGSSLPQGKSVRSSNPFRQ